MKSFLQAILLLALICTAIAVAEDNAIYKELTDQGVALANGKTIKLPEPVMADGLKVDQQQVVLTQIGPQNNPEHLKEFLRGDPRDWYELKEASEKGSKDNDSIGRRIDLYFVAKGKLETIASQGFIKEQIKQAKAGNATNNANANKTQSGKIEFYTDDELKQRKLTATDNDNLKERYAHGVMNLLDQVQVEGSGYAIQTRTPDSVLVAFKLDPRFDKDSKYPNQYQTITIDAAGKKVFGTPKPYAGFAGYAKITKLNGSENKVFVEYHLIYDEPFDWFQGSPALISKLDPGVYQTAIPKFRRDVLNAPPPAANNPPQAPNNPAAAPANNPPQAPNSTSPKAGK